MAKKDDNYNKGVSFCFTDFNETNITLGYKNYYNEYKDIIRGIAWGVEVCPTTGRKHNQGYIQLFKQGRWSSIQKMFKSKCHFEVMIGSIMDNEAYCSKENVYTKLGCFVSRGYRTDLHNIKDDIKNGASMYDIMENYTGDFVRYHSGINKMKELIDNNKSKSWRDVETTILVGVAGSGKTRYVYDNHGYNNVFKIDSSGDFVRYHSGINKMKELIDNNKSKSWRDVETTILVGVAGSGKTRYVYDNHGYNNVFKIDSSGDDRFMFNGYDGEDVLLIDDFKGWIKYTYMLNILDGYPLPLNVKNGRTFARWSKVYITSNNMPSMWYSKIKENFKRRIDNCLEVIEGNTKSFNHSNWWDIYDDDDEYGDNNIL